MLIKDNADDGDEDVPSAPVTVHPGADDLASTKLPDDRNSSKASSDDVAGGATAKDNDADKKSDASDQDADFLKLGRRVADEMSGRAKQPCTSTSMSFAEDTMMRRIFIGGLPHTVTEVDVEAQFQRFGEITDIAIKRKGADGSSNPFAFVTFSDGAAAGAAVSEMNRSQSFGDGGEILVQHQREGKGSGGKGGFSSSFNGKIVSSSKSGALGFSGGGLGTGASAGSSTKQDLQEQVEEQSEKAAAPKAKGKEPYGGGTNYPKKGGGRERMRSGRSRSPGGLNRSGGRRDRGRVAPRTAAPSSSKLQSDCDPTAVYLNGKKFFPGYSTGLGFFDTPAIREGGMRVNGMMNAADEESDGDPSVYRGDATLTYNFAGGCMRDFYSIGGGEGASNRDLRQGVRDKAAAPHVVEAFRALLRGDFGRAAGAAGIHNFIPHKGAGKGSSTNTKGTGKHVGGPHRGRGIHGACRRELDGKRDFDFDERSESPRQRQRSLSSSRGPAAPRRGGGGGPRGTGRRGNRRRSASWSGSSSPRSSRSRSHSARGAARRGGRRAGTIGRQRRASSSRRPPRRKSSSQRRSRSRARGENKGNDRAGGGVLNQARGGRGGGGSNAARGAGARGGNNNGSGNTKNNQPAFLMRRENANAVPLGSQVSQGAAGTSKIKACNKRPLKFPVIVF